MFNTSNKLFDQIFELKFTAKQLIKESKRCESEEKAQKVKAKQAMAKSNMEGARIHAQNAIRKKSEAHNYLQLASRLDAVIARLDEQSKMGNISKSMTGIVKTLNSTLKNTSLDKISTTMTSFEKQFIDLDLHSSVMNEAMNTQAALSTPPDQVETLLQKIADENDMDVQLNIPKARTEAVAPAAAATEDASLAERLAALRG